LQPNSHEVKHGNKFLNLSQVFLSKLNFSLANINVFLIYIPSQFLHNLRVSMELSFVYTYYGFVPVTKISVEFPFSPFCCMVGMTQ